MWRMVRWTMLIMACVFFAGMHTAHADIAVVASVEEGELDGCSALVNGSALVIGNDEYQHVVTLQDAVNDATDIGDALERNGFEVARLLNSDQTSMRKALGDLAKDAEENQIAVVFYVGHGVSAKGHSYLVPVDALIWNDADIPFQAVPLELALAAVERAPGFQLVILDGDFLTLETGSVPAISEEPSQTGGTPVMYAARPGNIVYEGEGRNSPFTVALLERLEKPGLEIGLMFRMVRDAIAARMGEYQEPYLEGRLPGRAIYLALPPESEACVKQP